MPLNIAGFKICTPHVTDINHDYVFYADNIYAPPQWMRVQLKINNLWGNVETIKHAAIADRLYANMDRSVDDADIIVLNSPFLNTLVYSVRKMISIEEPTK
jgi:hypothetical protein